MEVLILLWLPIYLQKEEEKKTYSLYGEFIYIDGTPTHTLQCAYRIPKGNRGLSPYE